MVKNKGAMMNVALLMLNSAMVIKVQGWLEKSGMDVSHYTKASMLISQFKNSSYEAIVLEDLDVQLEVWLGMIKMHAPSSIPVLVIGDQPLKNLTQAFAQGADDFTVLGDSGDELILRLRAHVELRKFKEKQVLHVGAYTLMAGNSCIRSGDEEIRLTTREFSLAWVLFSAAGRVVNLQTLASQVWGRPSDICKRTIEQHVYKLRCKLNAPRGGNVKIHAAYGIGYRLEIAPHPMPLPEPLPSISPSHLMAAIDCPKLDRVRTK